MYLIIGSNRMSKSVVERLGSSDEEISLWEGDIDDECGIEDEDEFTDILDRSELVLILIKDFEKTSRFVELIKDLRPSLPVLGLTKRYEERNYLIDLNCDSVVSEEEVSRDEILNETQILERKRKNHLMVKEILDSEGEISIFIHDNPDPDAIASAMSFEEICKELSKECTTYYSGELGYPENKIFVESTGFCMERITEEEIDAIVESSGSIVFIDFAQPGKNNIIPERYEPDIVIDHHQTNIDYDVEGFVEITTDVGATSTLMAQFLLDFNIDIDEKLASALIYGIKVDTRDFTKNIGEKDFEVLSYLMPIADKELLEVFESPPMEPHTLDALAEALSNRIVEDDMLTAYAGEVEKRDDLPQIVDIMTGERDIMTALVYGVLDEKIYMSARSKDISLDLGKMMENVFSDIGQAGGHKHAAGGSIDLDEFDDIDGAKEYINSRFRKGCKLI
ncbi:MAG: DHH family phosphoesterase [Thermoplasmatota archaeon]